jgi:hypothetical protein
MGVSHQHRARESLNNFEKGFSKTSKAKNLRKTPLGLP